MTIFDFANKVYLTEKHLILFITIHYFLLIEAEKKVLMNFNKTLFDIFNDSKS